MAFVTPLHLIFISVSLLLLRTFRGRLSNNQMKVIFIFFIFLSLFPVIFLAPTQFYHSFRVFDKITLFLFIPGCYIYMLTNLYKPQPKKINLFHLRFWIARFTSYINPSGRSRHRVVRKHKTETKQPIPLSISQERTVEIEENIRNHFSRNKPF